MRKTFLKVSLLAVLGLGMSASFTGCKDYQPDIDKNTEAINQLKSEIEKINALVSSGSVITSVSQNAEGVTFTLSNGQSYTVKNGAKGQDADVWTIVTNAAGEYVWAKNGVATEFPAQGKPGKPGENGTAEPGIYYQPNEDGYFYKVDPAKGTSEKTPISWKAKGGALSAVATGDKVILSGLVDADGKPAEDITIWRSMFIKSLVAVPGFYLDGIEATRYKVIENQNILATTKTTENKNVGATTDPKVLPGASKGAVVAKGQPWEYANADKNPPITINEIATLAYHLNPSNAVTEGMKWNLLIDDKEVINRSTGVKCIEGYPTVSKVDANGDVTMTYQLTGTEALAPYSDLGGKADADKAEWTMMALQAANPQTDSALVASNNVVVVKRQVTLNHLLQSQDGKTWVQTYDNATVAIQQAANPATQVSKSNKMPQPNTLPVTGTDKASAGVLLAPYNATYDLASHIAIETSWLDPMLQTSETEQNSADVASNTKTQQVLSLAAAKKLYGLTASYQLVTYTINPNSTSEDQFAQINQSTGVITPCWVDGDGSQKPIPGTTAGTSAIGRSPMVYVTLADTKGQIVLAGFVKIIYTTQAVNEGGLVLSTNNLPYICNNTVASTWEQITGYVYEKLNVTAEQFSNNYFVERTDGATKDATGAINVYVGNAFTPAADAFKAFAGAAAPKGWTGLGSFTWDTNDNGTHTQKLTFTMDNVQYANWYAKYNSTSKAFTYNVTTTPVQNTVYAKFVNPAENKTVYIGFTLNLAAPSVTYSGKLISQWTEDLEVAPVNPAVPGQTTDKTPVQKANGYPFASSIAMSFTSIWNGGKPAVAVDAPYNFTNDKGANYTPVQKVDYNFAATQPSYAGYTIAPAKNDKHALWATDSKKNTQPIAVITADDETGTTNPATVTGVWNVVSMLPYYQVAEGYVNTPKAATGDLTYAKFACDIVNSTAFVRDEPAITFNVEFVVSYGEMKDGKPVCTLTLPAERIQIGTGRPISLGETSTGSLKDAVNGSVLASKLFTMVDWQGHLLWNVNRSGTVTASTFNSTNLANFWFSQTPEGEPDLTGTIDPNCPNYDQFGLTIDLANAVVSNTTDIKDNLGKFNAVYGDKKLTFSLSKDATTTKLLNAKGEKPAADEEPVIAFVSNYTELDDVAVEWTNNGSSVTSNIYVFVPVSVTYVWGLNINLGYAVITIQPTLSAE